MMNPDLERLIDRLVDGELSHAARRELLVRLDSEPDGWRRCSLAFLEAQSWRGSLGPVAAEVRSMQPAGGRARADRKLGRASVGRVVIAAGLVTAFLLGWAAAGGARRRDPVVASTGAGESAGAALPQEHMTGDGQTPHAAERPHQVNPSPVSRQALSSLSPPATDGRRESNGFLADRVRRQWEREGFEIQEQRALMTVQLKDGRRVALPVEEVKFHYVGRRSL